MIRLENVLKISLQDVLKTSWRCLEDVFARRLENVLKTYGQDEYIGLDQDVLKTSSEDVRLRRTYSSWSRRLEDVFWRRRRKTSSRSLQDVFIKTNVWWVNSSSLLLLNKTNDALYRPWLKKSKHLQHTNFSYKPVCKQTPVFTISASFVYLIMFQWNNRNKSLSIFLPLFALIDLEGGAFVEWYLWLSVLTSVSTCCLLFMSYISCFKIISININCYK